MPCAGGSSLKATGVRVARESRTSRDGEIARCGISGGAPPAWPYLLILALWLAGTVEISRQVVMMATESPHSGWFAGVAWVVLALVVVSKSVGLYYLLGTVAKSVTYVAKFRRGWGHRRASGGSAPDSPRAGSQGQPLVVLYLTAGDFDAEAVASLMRVRTSGPKLFLIHDDGNDDAARERMRRFVEARIGNDEWQFEIWHRPSRVGGKAGAVNWCLERLDPRWELLLLCDSDSIAVDPEAIVASEGEFDDPRVSVVQYRNVGHAAVDDPPFHRRLSRAIDVFDVFAGAQSVWGYTPFFGHNALIRVRDMREHGGFTPGFFSDDLDFSARLTLAGKRIVYRGDIVFAERHPADHDAFRKRARKWALGCTQVVRHRARDVASARGIPFAHRVGLLEFMAFYPAMALMFLGLLAGHLVLPALFPGWVSSPVALAAGTVVAMALLSPTLAWAIVNRRLGEWPALAWSCILVYGNSLIPTIQGVVDGLSTRERPWIPTNLTQARRTVPREAWGEFALGACLLVVPWFLGGPELHAPSTYLFIATFLFAPLTFAGFRKGAPSIRVQTIPSLSRSIRWLAVASAAGVLLLAATVSRGEPLSAVRGEQLFMNHQPVQIRGIHYSPWGPGTGPDGTHPYPERSIVEQDLRRIVNLGANTVLIHSAPGWVADAAAEHGLFVIYKLHMSWNDTSEEAFERESRRALAEIESLKSHRGIFLWVLGNEVPRWVVDALGSAVVANRLNGLAGRVRAIDRERLIGHANWPPTKELDLSAMDVVCFNLYPAWPYEVSVRGFGPYLREVLVPLAGGRPLLITEFGINTLEAGESRQAQVISDCWREIESSGIAGGVVFSWMDEWWKNFDNPIPGKGYWEREYAPDDALRHDEDPEEHYGIVRSDRTPKAAYYAVGAMWAGKRSRELSVYPWLVVLGLGVLSWLVLGLGRRRPAAADQGVGEAS